MTRRRDCSVKGLGCGDNFSEVLEVTRKGKVTTKGRMMSGLVARLLAVLLTLKRSYYLSHT